MRWRILNRARRRELLERLAELETRAAGEQDRAATFPLGSVQSRAALEALAATQSTIERISAELASIPL